jgi:two-component system response regulator RegA
MEMAARSVLLVDDDDTFLSTFGREFARHKWRVATAANGEQATQRAREKRPSVIVLDLMLGDGPSALELIPELRRTAPGARIVVLTGSATIATAVDAIKRGADNYLEKPATVAQILSAIEARAPTQTLAQQERAHIARVMQAVGGNVSEAARLLRMHRRTLQRKLRKNMPE